MDNDTLWKILTHLGSAADRASEKRNAQRQRQVPTQARPGGSGGRGNSSGGFGAAAPNGLRIRYGAPGNSCNCTGKRPGQK